MVEKKKATKTKKKPTKPKKKDLMCRDHPKKYAVAQLDGIGMCKRCLFDFIIDVDKQMQIGKTAPKTRPLKISAKKKR